MLARAKKILSVIVEFLIKIQILVGHQDYVFINYTHYERKNHEKIFLYITFQLDKRYLDNQPVALI